MSDKKSTVKLTLADLVARKQQSESDKAQFKEVYVEKLGGCLTLKKLPLGKMLEMMDAADENASLRESLDYEVGLIYESCPMLHNKELIGDLAEPTDVVYKLLEDDIGAIAELAAAVLDFYGMGGSVREQLKN